MWSHQKEAFFNNKPEPNFHFIEGHFYFFQEFCFLFQIGCSMKIQILIALHVVTPKRSLFQQQAGTKLSFHRGSFLFFPGILLSVSNRMFHENPNSNSATCGHTKKKPFSTTSRNQTFIS